MTATPRLNTVIRALENGTTVNSTVVSGSSRTVNV